MGWRGGSAGGDWKSELRKMAKRGQMPNAIVGNKDMQARVSRQINSLYSIPADFNQFMFEKYANVVQKDRIIYYDPDTVRIKFENTAFMTYVSLSEQDSSFLLSGENERGNER